MCVKQQNNNGPFMTAYQLAEEREIHTGHWTHGDEIFYPLSGMLEG